MLQAALRQPLFSTRSAATTTVGSSGLTSILQSIGLGSSSSVPVNNNTALTLSAFYSGINIICSDFAKLPKGVFKKVSEGREAVSDHSVNYMINKRPNQYMTAFQFDSIMLQSAILKGNAIAIIERDTNGKILALQYVDQDKNPCEAKISQNKLWYKIQGYRDMFRSENILHIPGFTTNGIWGEGVITYAAQTLGVSLSSQKFAGEYYNGKAIGTGFISTDKDMEDPAKKRYSDGFTGMLSKQQSYKVPVLDNGMKFTGIKITAQESEFLLASEHGINEIARILNVSPVKLHHYKDLNNAISESLQIQHVSDSILPWALKFEQEYDSKLFSQADKNAGYDISADVSSLLRADMKAQAEYYSKLVFAGVMTRNEVRAKLELNSIKGLSEPLTPVNAQTMEQIDAKVAELKKD